MANLPHEVDRLGPEVLAWLEAQLLGDLRYYGVAEGELNFDWTQALQEGHWMEYRGRMLESLSDICLRRSDGTLVAEGWMDFVTTSLNGDFAPKVFWLFLSVRQGGEFQKVKRDPFIPTHLWDSLTDAERQHVANHESKFALRDPKIKEWRRHHPPASK